MSWAFTAVGVWNECMARWWHVIRTKTSDKFGEFWSESKADNRSRIPSSSELQRLLLQRLSLRDVTAGLERFVEAWKRIKEFWWSPHARSCAYVSSRIAQISSFQNHRNTILLILGICWRQRLVAMQIGGIILGMPGKWGMPHAACVRGGWAKTLVLARGGRYVQTG